MMEIYVFGCGGHAKVITDILTDSDFFQIVGYLLDPEYIKEPTFLGKPIIPIENVANFESPNIVIAIGDNFSRKKTYERIKSLNVKSVFPNIIHRSAIISKMNGSGFGNVFIAGSIVNACTNIGNFCILNSGSILEHDSSLRDFSSLGPLAVVGGGSDIGECSSVCISAVISHSVNIGKNTVIGGNSFVNRDIPNDVVAYGSPARIIRLRIEDEQYL